MVRIFRRSADPVEDVLRRLSKRLRWFRPSLTDAPTAQDQLGHLMQHRLCPAIDQGDAGPVVAALTVVEEALADGEVSADLHQALTLGLIEVVSDWCSWPETPPEVVAAIRAGMGPTVRAQWESIRDQGTAVAGWMRTEGASGEAPSRYRGIENPDLRFLVRSTRQYIDETMTVSTGDRLRFEKATGRGI